MANGNQSGTASSTFPQFLTDGYYRFRRNELNGHRDLYAKLASEGQKPPVMMIGCSDSRAAPETIFNAAPGDIFVVRNVANFVPPYSTSGENHSVSSALEFAVQALGARDVVVMGHAKCGGIAAFRQQITGTPSQPLSDGNFVGKWIDQFKPLADRLSDMESKTAEELQWILETESVRQSIDNLKAFPFVSSLIESGDLRIHGAWFDLSNGELWTLDNNSGEFAKAA